MADVQNDTGLTVGRNHDDEYVRAQCRRSLYRVLATNIVSQLRDAGYQGHELPSFASEVIQAIADNGWEHAPNAAQRSHRGRLKPRIRHELAADGNGLTTMVGERITLRRPAPSDRSLLERWGKDPQVRASLIPSVLQQVLRKLGRQPDETDRIDLIIVERTTEQVVGLVTLHDIDTSQGQAELGKVLGEPALRGRGYAEEATRLLVGYGFESLGLNRICLRTLGVNVRNIRLNERMGFRLEGVLRQASTRDGQPTDVILMAMLRSEFEAETDSDGD